MFDECLSYFMPKQAALILAAVGFVITAHAYHKLKKVVGDMK